jgi:hypothetical protein
MQSFWGIIVACLHGLGQPHGWWCMTIYARVQADLHDFLNPASPYAALYCASYMYVSAEYSLHVVPSSTHLGVRKVHLRMLLLELLQEVQLLLLVAGGLAGLLLALVEHHLLDHAPCLSVEVAELAVLGLDLAGVDLGRRGDDMGPPLELVLLV